MDPMEAKSELRNKCRTMLEKANIHQESVECPTCWIVLDPNNKWTEVRFRQVMIGGRPFVLLDPVCPICGTVFESKYYLVH